ncbi:MAG: Cys-rich peptide radical SAM maturase CcpM [Eubacterium sp.]
MMSIIYKVFRTPLHNYLYDRNTNKILRISEADYKSLSEKEADKDVIRKFQKRGFLLEDKLEGIEHPNTKILHHILENRMEYLLLQVTQECNLRCSYCVYGGNYENRKHSNRDMTFDLARRAIQYYVKRSSEMEELTLGFYGGEPLLNMKLITKCVDYIKQLVPDKPINFTLTTNGTLLTLDTARYLYENGFDIVISLDGAKEDHDKNRVFKDSGKGTFNVIMRHMKTIKDNLPEFMSKISFNTVLNYNCNFSCVKDYYNTNEVVKDAYSVFNLVETTNTYSESEFSKRFLIEYKYEQFLLFMYMLSKCEKKYLLHSQLINMIYYRDFFRMVKESGTIDSKWHHNGPCVPGARRLFVSVTGEFYPCEKVPEEKVTQIGDIDRGIDEMACEKILNIGKITEKNCESCWALRICDQCVAKAIDKNSISREKKLCCCPESRSIALDKLKVVSMLNEFGVSLEEVIE